MVNQEWEEPLGKARPFGIAKRVVWEAYKRVKANQGAAGVDGESIVDHRLRRFHAGLLRVWCGAGLPALPDPFSPDQNRGSAGKPHVLLYKPDTHYTAASLPAVGLSAGPTTCGRDSTTED